jgi:hypothetical protein
MKRCKPETLQRKLDKWVRTLKLDDWDITIKYSTESLTDKDTNEITCACVSCAHSDKTAKIEVSREYYKANGHKTEWNIDILIIHELIHIILEEKVKNLSERVKENKKYLDLEEHICWVFARLIYNLKHARL